MGFLVVLIVVILVIALFIWLKYEIAQNEAKGAYYRPVFSSGELYEHLEYFNLKGVHRFKRKTYILGNCQELDAVKLKHEPNNEYSDTAIMVLHNGKLIGYVPDDETEFYLEVIKSDYKAYIDFIDFDGSYLDVSVTLKHNYKYCYDDYLDKDF